MTDVREWQNRPLEKSYPILFLDVLRVNSRQDGKNINKDLKAICRDLKEVYSAINAESGHEALEEFGKKWNDKYPMIQASWERNWNDLTEFFNYPKDIRRAIYTTNAIESLNSSYRKLNRQRSVFPSDQALLKALDLATFEATKKWTQPLSNWSIAYGEMCIMYEVRLPD